MLSVPQVNSWKIEGRKKGPHYVYYAVTAYRMLRDEPNNAQTRKNALELLDLALGRPSSHSIFLPQRPFTPLEPGNETGSGMLIGISKQGKNAFFTTRQELLPGDFLRVGYQDQPGHRTMRIRRFVPKKGRVDIPGGKGKIYSGTKIFLIDRREQGLVTAINELDKELKQVNEEKTTSSSFNPDMPRPFHSSDKTMDMFLMRNPPKGKNRFGTSVWLSKNALERTPRHSVSKNWWHLPPVIWPDEEKQWSDLISATIDLGAQDFVLNAPWQMSLFKKNSKELRFHAGPFCNVSNALAVQKLKDLGFSSAFVCPELAKDDFINLPSNSPLPLGVVLKGMWPLGISRIIAEETPMMSPLYSRKKEICWVRKYDQNYWIFPGWPLDLSKERRTLEKAGYSMFLEIQESWPKAVPEPQRISTFNWELTLY
jgi:putative protease